jgi:hypothetical protein
MDMSLLIHRCGCGHADFAHHQNGSCLLNCGCKKADYPEQPEVIRSWATDWTPGAGMKTVENETLIKPGASVKGFTRKLCDSSPCENAYAQLAP